MSETKKCPFCGEEILSTAIKCKHCREFLEKQVDKIIKEKKYLNFTYSFTLENARRQFIDFLEKKYTLENLQLNTRTWSVTKGSGSFGDRYVSSINSTVHSKFDIAFKIEISENINKEYIDLVYKYFNLTYNTEISIFIILFISLGSSFFIGFSIDKYMHSFFKQNEGLIILTMVFILPIIIGYYYHKNLIRIRKDDFEIERKSISNIIKNYKIGGNENIGNINTGTSKESIFHIFTIIIVVFIIISIV